jgi:hypothetical protein
VVALRPAGERIESLAVASDFSAGRGRGSGISLGAGALRASPATRPTAKTMSIRRIAVTGTEPLCRGAFATSRPRALPTGDPGNLIGWQD